MAPNPPPLSRAYSRESFYDAEQSSQAGRSQNNLAAQASAQSLREASRSGRPTSSSSNTQRNLLSRRPSNRPHAVTTDHALTSPSGSDPPNSGVPFITGGDSPTDPRPTGADSIDGSRRNSGDGSIVSTSSNNTNGPAGPSRQTSRMGLLRPSAGTLHNNSSVTSLSRMGTPRSVRDLGSDYTRYYNPFASTADNSRNNSQLDLSSAQYGSTTQLLPNQGLSGTDLERRLSNPFDNRKRYSAGSNPFESASNTIPGTPVYEGRDDGGKGAKAAGGAVITTEAMSPYGTPGFITDADPEKNTFFPYMDDRLGAPEYGFPLFADEKEDDDDMHMPAWDDDIKLKPKFKDHFTRENMCSTFGLVFVILGLLTLFVVLPVVSWTGTSLINYTYQTPLDQMPGKEAFEPWSWVNDEEHPLFRNMRQGLIDPDTPKSAGTRKGLNGAEYKLVFSDEFNEQNRTFYMGDDPYWYAPDIWYGATNDLEWYDPDAVNTGDGTLRLQMDHFQIKGQDFRSGMLNSWNQLCFKGGMFEVSISLPGPAGVHGLWPGAWTMGNLGRPGYLASTEGVWPYTYDSCDAGITANQSMEDGTSILPGQKLASCVCPGEDTPSPGRGRGAPEIDIAEVSADWGDLSVGVATQTYQVAPFDIWWYPNYDFMELPNYNLSMVNTWAGGPLQQAVSTTTMLNNSWYDGEAFQSYSYEYVPGTSSDSHVTWWISDERMMTFDARAIGPNGNVGQRVIAEEPLHIILNLGISENWVAISWDELKFPAVMQFDYVRWYQKEGQEMVTCDPPGYETTKYIRDHIKAYNNPNVTTWEDTGYPWPKNSLVHGCD